MPKNAKQKREIRALKASGRTSYTEARRRLLVEPGGPPVAEDGLPVAYDWNGGERMFYDFWQEWDSSLPTEWTYRPMFGPRYRTEIYRMNLRRTRTGMWWQLDHVLSRDKQPHVGCGDPMNLDQLLAMMTDASKDHTQARRWFDDLQVRLADPPKRPVIDTIIVGSEQYIPRCPFCRRVHSHGAGNGSRTPHCEFDVRGSEGSYLLYGHEWPHDFPLELSRIITQGYRAVLRRDKLAIIEEAIRKAKVEESLPTSPRPALPPAESMQIQGTDGQRPGRASRAGVTPRPTLRLTAKRKAYLTFLAKDFAPYLTAYEPSLAATLRDLPAVTDTRSLSKVLSAYNEARVGFPAGEHDFGTVMKVSWLNDVLQDAREAFHWSDPGGRVAAALHRFAHGEDVGWHYAGADTTPLWRAARSVGCEVEVTGEGQQLLGPYVYGSKWRTVLGTFPAGTLTP